MQEAVKTVEKIDRSISTSAEEQYELYNLEDTIHYLGNPVKMARPIRVLMVIKGSMHMIKTSYNLFVIKLKSVGHSSVTYITSTHRISLLFTLDLRLRPQSHVITMISYYSRCDITITCHVCKWLFLCKLKVQLY